MELMIIFGAQYAIYLQGALLILAFLVSARRRGWLRDLMSFGVGIMALAILVTIATSLHYEPRPYVVYGTLEPVIQVEDGNAFPSDHAALAGFLGCFTLGRSSRIGCFSVGIAALVGVGRVAAHVHSFLDVGVGILIGLLWGLIVFARRCADLKA